MTDTKKHFEIYYDLDENCRGTRVKGVFFSLKAALDECANRGIDHNYKITCTEINRYTVEEAVQ